MKIKLLDIITESYEKELGDPLDGRKNACFSSLYKAHQHLADALRMIENAYQECDDEEMRQEIIEFKRDLMHDFGHGDGDGFNPDDDNEDNLINRISNFIDTHTPKNWDANIHDKISPHQDVD